MSILSQFWKNRVKSVKTPHVSIGLNAHGYPPPHSSRYPPQQKSDQVLLIIFHFLGGCGWPWTCQKCTWIAPCTAHCSSVQKSFENIPYRQRTPPSWGSLVLRFLLDQLESVFIGFFSSGELFCEKFFFSGHNTTSLQSCCILSCSSKGLKQRL